MAGLLARLAGRSGGQADPDPNPGLTIPAPARGPAGETGNPGTTSYTRLNPAAAAEKRPFAPLRPVRTPPWGRNVARPRYATVVEQQANVIPEPAENGSLPYQGPAAKTNPDSVRHTERRGRIVTSAGIPGGQRQRNTTYYGGQAAIPGAPHTYRSASKGDGFGITESSIPSRYVFGGVNGGTDALDDMMQDRRMPYTGHHGTLQEIEPVKGLRSVRGAVLDGTRYYAIADTELNQGGAYGRSARGTPTRRHRPTIFTEPAPMNSQLYDTTTSTGTPDVAGSHAQVVDQVHVSPSVGRRGWRRGG